MLKKSSALPASWPSLEVFSGNKICVGYIFLHRDGGWGEQFNKQTAFIDASAVYGCHQVKDSFPNNFVVKIHAHLHQFWKSVI